jgi:hypothetical protein
MVYKLILVCASINNKKTSYNNNYFAVSFAPATTINTTNTPSATATTCTAATAITINTTNTPSAIATTGTAATATPVANKNKIS